MTATSDKLPVVILISGTGSNMQRLAELAQAGELPVTIKAVISDRAEARGLITAAKMGLTTAVLNPKQFADRAQFDAALAKLVDSHGPRLVILAGFMRILGQQFIARFADRMLNIHPSLLPKHRGLHTHQRTLDAGDREHGASVHFVTAELDGGPVVMQARVPVLADDTVETLAKRVLQQEHRIFPEAIRLFADGRLKSLQGHAWLDGQELKQPMQILSNDPSAIKAHRAH
ncbi:MAG: phosphoribosylglycinamide formyltransferase [Steroidobacteraceae bacterium]